MGLGSEDLSRVQLGVFTKSEALGGAECIRKNIEATNEAECNERTCLIF